MAPLPDPREVFHAAVGYMYAVQKLSPILQEDIDRAVEGLPTGMSGPAHLLPMPILVMQAFSLELHLKALRIKERKVHKNGHDLRVLFDSLTSDTRAAIRVLEQVESSDPWVRHTRSLTGDNLSFDDRLDRCRDTFKVLRYSFEPHNFDNSNWLAETILNATHAACCTLYPEWMEGLQTSPANYPIEVIRR
jgi:hypothetical protein